MRALLIEDDQDISAAVEMILRAENFDVNVAYLGEDGIERAKLHDYDVILLDLNLSDISGYDVLSALRSANVITPVLIVSGHQETEDKVRALRLGADDYITKPFHKDELLARVRTVIRRSVVDVSKQVRTGELVVDLQHRSVFISGSHVHLTRREFSMLELLSQRKGSLVTKEMFLNHMYGGMDEPEDKIIDVFLCKLRKKLMGAGNGYDYIETVWGRGHLLRDPLAAKSVLVA